MIVLNLIPTFVLVAVLIICAFIMGTKHGLASRPVPEPQVIPAAAYAEVNSWVPDLEPVGLRPTPPPRQSPLPDRHIDRDNLRDMAVGDKAWTLPWGMSVSQGGAAWLNGSYPAEVVQKHNGIGQMTLTMLVERREDGYYVKIPAGEKYDFVREGRPGGTWGEIPVAGWIR